jgi:hypothetical protein
LSFGTIIESGVNKTAEENYFSVSGGSKADYAPENK